MQNMTTEPNNSVLDFPYQLATDLTDCYDIEVLYFQGRLWMTKAISLVQAGERPLTDDLLHAFHEFNDVCRAWGKPPIDFSF